MIICRSVIDVKHGYYIVKTMVTYKNTVICKNYGKPFAKAMVAKPCKKPWLFVKNHGYL